MIGLRIAPRARQRTDVPSAGQFIHLFTHFCAHAPDDIIAVNLAVFYPNTSYRDSRQPCQRWKRRLKASHHIWRAFVFPIKGLKENEDK